MDTLSNEDKANLMEQNIIEFYEIWNRLPLKISLPEQNPGFVWKSKPKKKKTPSP